ncbi:hypothetical protein GYA13_01500 [Candidatus Kuenenbacteria bacterium]|nr:hypothetical protein [Candidatus Kuenenbacteria bacterium]
MKTAFFWFFLGGALAMTPAIYFWSFQGYLFFFTLELLAGLIWVMKPTAAMPEDQLVKYLPPPIDAGIQAW